MSNETVIRTNNKPRPLIYGFELTDDDRREFDYITSDEFDTHEFFRYRGVLYDPCEFMRLPKESNLAKKWQGYRADSYFSGVLIRYTEDCESVVVGFWYS